MENFVKLNTLYKLASSYIGWEKTIENMRDHFKVSTEIN